MHYVSEWELFFGSSARSSGVWRDPLEPAPAPKMPSSTEWTSSPKQTTRSQATHGPFPASSFQSKFICDALLRDSLQPGWPRYNLEAPEDHEMRDLIAQPAFRVKELARLLQLEGRQYSWLCRPSDHA
ncbi:hypothetical protein K466DRAFT_591280 [Polyporus arcularius HHB13444]|uniref:Uncharacterized protein n=1 Tax=Polyporus arcularius HHB13444 TaxID=1314778 RepID=A0A5C3NXY3_9APHY|nr:hypothetical protein K466DRAFT_591280 [Polyporus arcularius HHB13444]